MDSWKSRSGRVGRPRIDLEIRDLIRRISCENPTRDCRASSVVIDFFVVPTVTFNILYGFVVLLHNRRQVVHFNATAHPPALWTAQQIIEAFPEETAPRFLLRDSDSINGEEFRTRGSRGRTASKRQNHFSPASWRIASSLFAGSIRVVGS
jgi:hypothetical protein